MKDEKSVEAITLERSDLPSLYHTSTLASQNAQDTLLILTKANIAVLVIGAFLSAINLSQVTDASLLKWIPIAGTSFLVISIFVTVTIELAGYERKWYDGRAMAESIKTLTWRFMMNSEPYQSEHEPEKRFLQDLEDILKEKKSFAELLGGQTAVLDEVTEKMKEIKNSKFTVKKEIYLKNRIKSQRKWYSTKCKQNQQNGSLFFWGIIVSQIVAILISLILQTSTDTLINPTGVITTLTAGLLAWTQLKQFKTLAESYGLTARELGIIESKFASIRSNDELSHFVLEAETAISREHTMWLARRVNI